MNSDPIYSMNWLAFANIYCPPFLAHVLQGFLVIPKSITSTYGNRAFPVAAPKLWNNMPVNIRTTISIDSFKRKLKTHLFQIAFL